MAEEEMPARRGRTPYMEATEPLLPGKLALELQIGFDHYLTAATKMWKSLIACNLAAAVSQVGRVLYSTYEDLPLAKSLRPRLEAAGANFDNIDDLQLPILPGGLRVWQDRLRGGDYMLAIIDTAQKHSSIDVHQAMYATLVMAPVAELFAETDTTGLTLTHILSHIKKHEPPLRVFGKAISGTMRCGFLLGPDPDDAERRIAACAAWSNGAPFKSKAFELETKQLWLPARVAGGKIWQDVAYAVCVGESNVTDEDLVEAYRTGSRIGRPPEKHDACQHDLVQLLTAEVILPRAEVMKRLQEMGHKSTVAKEVIAESCQSADLPGGRKQVSLKASVVAELMAEADEYDDDKALVDEQHDDNINLNDGQSDDSA